MDQSKNLPKHDFSSFAQFENGLDCHHDLALDQKRFDLVFRKGCEFEGLLYWLGLILVVHLFIVRVYVFIHGSHHLVFMILVREYHFGFDFVPPALSH